MISKKFFFREGFQKWLSRTGVLNYDVWLLPIIKNSHWSLLIISFRDKLFLYIDLVHGRPPQIIIDSYISLIDCEMSNKQKTPDWEEWRILPKWYITSEHDEWWKKNLSGDCGIHVGVHVHLGVRNMTSSSRVFSSNDMLIAKKSIARYIMIAAEPKKVEQAQLEYMTWLIDSDDAKTSRERNILILNHRW